MVGKINEINEWWIRRIEMKRKKLTTISRINVKTDVSDNSYELLSFIEDLQAARDRVVGDHPDYDIVKIDIEFDSSSGWHGEDVDMDINLIYYGERDETKKEISKRYAVNRAKKEGQTARRRREAIAKEENELALYKALRRKWEGKL